MIGLSLEKAYTVERLQLFRGPELEKRIHLVNFQTP